MAWQRDTLAQIISRIEGKLVSEVEDEFDSPVLRRAVLRLLARAFAGGVHMLGGHIAWAVRQQRAKTADEQELLQMAAEDGVYRNAANFSRGAATISGTNGTVIPAGSVLLYGEVEFVTAVAVTVGAIVSGQATATLAAVLAGESGNVAAGEPLTFQTSIIGASSAVVASGGLSGGADQEEIEDFRARYLEERRKQSLGGGDDDYILWAKQVTGVTRAWVYRFENGLGTVVVRFVRDADASIIPDSTEVAAVQAKLSAERPTTAEVTAAAPAGLAQNFSITISPDTSEKRAQVEAELKDLYFRKARPGDGAGAGTILLSEMRTAIGLVSPNYLLISPTADQVPALGQMPMVGVLSFVS